MGTVEAKERIEEAKVIILGEAGKIVLDRNPL